MSVMKSPQIRFDPGSRGGVQKYEIFRMAWNIQKYQKFSSEHSLSTTPTQQRKNSMQRSVWFFFPDVMCSNNPN